MRRETRHSTVSSAQKVRPNQQQVIELCVGDWCLIPWPLPKAAKTSFGKKIRSATQATEYFGGTVVHKNSRTLRVRFDHDLSEANVPGQVLSRFHPAEEQTWCHCGKALDENETCTNRAFCGQGACETCVASLGVGSGENGTVWKYNSKWCVPHVTWRSQGIMYCSEECSLLTVHEGETLNVQDKENRGERLVGSHISITWNHFEAGETRREAMVVGYREITWEEDDGRLWPIHNLRYTDGLHSKNSNELVAEEEVCLNRDSDDGPDSILGNTHWSIQGGKVTKPATARKRKNTPGHLAIQREEQRRLELPGGNDPASLPPLVGDHLVASRALSVFWEQPYSGRKDCEDIIASMLNYLGFFFGYDFTVTDAARHSPAMRKRIGYFNQRGHSFQDEEVSVAPQSLEKVLGLTSQEMPPWWREDPKLFNKEEGRSKALSCIRLERASQRYIDMINDELQKENPFEADLRLSKEPLGRKEGTSNCIKGAQELCPRQMVRSTNLVPNKHGLCVRLAASHLEEIMQYPPAHTAVGVDEAKRSRMLGQSFQVGTMLQYFRVFKQQAVGSREKFVLVSFFAGIGGDLVALEQLKIPVRLVITVEKDPHSRRVLKAFLQGRSSDPKSTFYGCRHYCYDDICTPNAVWNSECGVEALVRKFGLRPGRVIVTGGSPCDNMPGTSNRGSKEDLRGQSGLRGEKTILFLVMVRSMVMLLEALTAKSLQKVTEATTLVDWDTGLVTNSEESLMRKCRTCNGTRLGETWCELGLVKLCRCHTALQALQWITTKMRKHKQPAATHDITMVEVEILIEDFTCMKHKRPADDTARKESTEGRPKKRSKKVSAKKSDTT